MEEDEMIITSIQQKEEEKKVVTSLKRIPAPSPTDENATITSLKERLSGRFKSQISGQGDIFSRLKETRSSVSRSKSPPSGVSGIRLSPRGSRSPRNRTPPYSRRSPPTGSQSPPPPLSSSQIVAESSRPSERRRSTALSWIQIDWEKERVRLSLEIEALKADVAQKKMEYSASKSKLHTKKSEYDSFLKKMKKAKSSSMKSIIPHYDDVEDQDLKENETFRRSFIRRLLGLKEQAYQESSTSLIREQLELSPCYLNEYEEDESLSEKVLTVKHTKRKKDRKKRTSSKRKMRKLVDVVRDQSGYALENPGTLEKREEEPKQEVEGGSSGVCRTPSKRDLYNLHIGIPVSSEGVNGTDSGPTVDLARSLEEKVTGYEQYTTEPASLRHLIHFGHSFPSQKAGRTTSSISFLRPSEASEEISFQEREKVHRVRSVLVPHPPFTPLQIEMPVKREFSGSLSARDPSSMKSHLTLDSPVRDLTLTTSPEPRNLTSPSSCYIEPPLSLQTSSSSSRSPTPPVGSPSPQNISESNSSSKFSNLSNLYVYSSPVSSEGSSPSLSSCSTASSQPSLFSQEEISRKPVSRSFSYERKSSASISPRTDSKLSSSTSSSPLGSDPLFSAYDKPPALPIQVQQLQLDSSSEDDTADSDNIITPPPLNLPYARERIPPIHATEILPEVNAALNQWTDQFKKCVNLLKKTKHQDLKKRIEVNTELMYLSEDFKYASRAAGKIIIAEVGIEPKDKAMKPLTAGLGGQAGGEKYIVHGILFKFSLDSSFLFGGSDLAASKVSGQELKGLMAYFGVGMRGVHLPLMALVDYRGFRLVAISLLPVNKKTLIYGTNDAGFTVVNKDENFSRKMEKAAVALNLQPHLCGLNKPLRLSSAADVEGHLGTDGEYYLLDFSRTMPPVLPDVRYRNGHLYYLFRREFVRKYPVPLCSDAYSGFIQKDKKMLQYNEEISKATQHLFDVEIPKCAKKLYESFSNAGSPLNFDVSLLIHLQGVNLRYIGKLLDCVQSMEKDDSDFHVSKSVAQSLQILLHCEAIARVLKNELNFLLRKKVEKLRLPKEIPYRQLVVDFINLVFGTSREQEQWWADTLPPLLVHSFNINPMPISRPCAYCHEWFETTASCIFCEESFCKSCQGGLDRSKNTCTKGSVHSFENSHSGTFCSEIFRIEQGNYRCVIFERLVKLTGLVFVDDILKKIQNPSAKEVIDMLDLIEIGDRVKSMDIVTVSQGNFFLMRSLTVCDPSFQMHLLQRAIEKYSDAINSNAEQETLQNLAISYLKLLLVRSSSGENKKESFVIFPEKIEGLFEAGEIFSRLLEAAPKDPICLCLAALFDWHKGDLANAEMYFLQSLKTEQPQGYPLFQYMLFLDWCGLHSDASVIYECLPTLMTEPIYNPLSFSEVVGMVQILVPKGWTKTLRLTATENVWDVCARISENLNIPFSSQSCLVMKMTPTVSGLEKLKQIGSDQKREGSLRESDAFSDPRPQERVLDKGDFPLILIQRDPGIVFEFFDKDIWTDELLKEAFTKPIPRWADSGISSSKEYLNILFNKAAVIGECSLLGPLLFFSPLFVPPVQLADQAMGSWKEKWFPSFLNPIFDCPLLSEIFGERTQIILLKSIFEGEEYRGNTNFSPEPLRLKVRKDVQLSRKIRQFLLSVSQILAPVQTPRKDLKQEDISLLDFDGAELDNLAFCLKQISLVFHFSIPSSDYMYYSVNQSLSSCIKNALHFEKMLENWAISDITHQLKDPKEENMFMEGPTEKKEEKESLRKSLRVYSVFCDLISRCYAIDDLQSANALARGLVSEEILDLHHKWKVFPEHFVVRATFESSACARHLLRPVGRRVLKKDKKYIKQTLEKNQRIFFPVSHILKYLNAIGPVIGIRHHSSSSDALSVLNLQQADSIFRFVNKFKIRAIMNPEAPEICTPLNLKLFDWLSVRCPSLSEVMQSSLSYNPISSQLRSPFRIDFAEEPVEKKEEKEERKKKRSTWTKRPQRPKKEKKASFESDVLSNVEDPFDSYFISSSTLSPFSSANQLAFSDLTHRSKHLLTSEISAPQGTPVGIFVPNPVPSEKGVPMGVFGFSDKLGGTPMGLYNLTPSPLPDISLPSEATLAAEEMELNLMLQEPLQRFASITEGRSESPASVESEKTETKSQQDKIED